MVQLCPHRDCTASYHLDESEDGKRFRCDQCGSTLLFHNGDLTIVADSTKPAEPEFVPATVLNEENSPMLSSPSEEKSTLNTVIAWLCTLLFGFGSFLIVLFFFLPVVDSAGLARQRDRIESGNRQQIRLDNRSRQKAVKERGKDDKDGPDAAADARKKEREEWEKSRERLEDDLEDAQNNALGRTYFYTWGLFFGFVILAMGSVGFLSFGPSTARRVFGGIIITFQIIVIFAAIYANFNLTRAMRPIGGF